MSFLVSSGAAGGGKTGYANALERALSITWSGTTNPLYPLSNLQLGRCDRPWKAAAVGTDQFFLIDLAQWTGGGFEEATLALAGWTDSSTSTTPAARSTAQHKAGVASALLTPAGGGYGRIQRDLVVPSGWRFVFDAWHKGGLGTDAYIQLFCPETGCYYDWDNEVWAQNSGLSVVIPNSGASFAETLATVRMQEAAAVGGVAATLRVMITSNIGGVALYVDEVNVWPVVNFAMVTGHNLRPFINLSILGGTSLVLSAEPLSFFAYDPNATTNDRVLEIDANGTPNEPASIGCLWLGWAEALSIGPDLGEGASVETDSGYRQEESEGTVHEQDDCEERTVRMSFTLSGDLTQYEELRDRLLRPAKGMAYPFALVADTEVEQEAIVARLSAKGWTRRRNQYGSWTVDIEATEEPLPNLTS